MGLGFPAGARMKIYGCPSDNHISIFGCPATFLVVPGVRTNKFSSTDASMRLVGYKFDAWPSYLLISWMYAAKIL